MSCATQQPSLEEAVVFQKFDAGREYRLTLLVAPESAGKTHLLQAWVASRKATGIRLGWMSLQTTDNRPGHFLDRLTSTLTPLLDAAIPYRSDNNVMDGVIDLINSLADIPIDFFLVLDGYHVIRAASVHQAVDLMLDYLPPHMHLIICSRNEPPLSIARLRARRQLQEIGSTPAR